MSTENPPISEFRLAFCQKLAAAGITPDEADRMAKVAMIGPLASAAGSAIGAAAGKNSLPALLTTAAGAGLGVGAGYGLHRLTQNPEAGKQKIEEFKQKQLADELKSKLYILQRMQAGAPGDAPITGGA